MSSRRRSFDERLEQAKLDAMKELAYGASHEINNPLANISLRAQSLLRDEVDPERRRALEAIHQQAMRAHEMISDLMLFARPPRLERQSVDVPKLLQDLQAELAAECSRRDVELRVASDAELPAATADPVQLAVAVKALIVNAIEAIGRGGEINVSTTLVDKGKTLRIEVADDGPGIPAEMLPRVFDPFYSGREAGRGLGFGLPKCWRIVMEHGGRVSAVEGASRGATLNIELPLDPTPAAG